MNRYEMEKTCELFFELIRITFGKGEKLSRKPTEKEWHAIYEESIRQAVAGIVFVGVQKLPKEQWPGLTLKLKWIALSERIRQRNLRVDKQTTEIWKQLKADGLDAAILKGQGIAQEYSELALYRQSGDIDIWVKGGYDTVCFYVQRTNPTTDVAYHRFHYDYFPDTEVELHHRPTLMRNLFDDRKLTKWYNSFGKENFVYLEDKGFAVPPREFNRFFILTHIYRHFLFEGIGLRQVMDYYFVLSNDKIIDKSEKIRIKETLQFLRLTRFAEAMMWILHTQFGLEEEKLICGMNKKEGWFVLNEIKQTGNFGYTDIRYQYKNFFKLRRQIAHGIHLLLHYPSEVIWTPIWLVYHKLWKWDKKRKIREMKIY